MLSAGAGGAGPGQGPGSGGGGGGGAGRGRGRPATTVIRLPRTEDKPKSNLSAEAKEWFPANYVPPSQDYYPDQGNVEYYNEYPNNYNYNHNHHHNRSNMGNQVYYQHNYERQNYGGGQRYSAQNRLRHYRHNEDNELQDSLTQLMGMLSEVTFSPGRFASLSGPLVDQFTATLNDVQHTQPLVDAIVNQAIKEQNFRYNAARLCTMFDSVEPQLETPSVFRACLLERCATEEANIISGTDVTIDYVCGFAMFLAELYMQFENPEGGRIKALGESLCKVLKHLLTTPANNSTKAVCQVLKLSGLALDADCKLHVDEIFFGLRASEAAQVQSLLVRNVINLRQNRWGSGGFAELVDSDTSTPTFPTQPNHQNGVSHNPAPTGRGGGRQRRNNGDSGMFYLPDGHALTSEEAAFLNQHLPSSRDQSFPVEEDEIGEDPAINIWEPEMDEEQQADFLEFLRLSNQVFR